MQTLYEISYYNATNDDFYFEQMYFTSEAEAAEGALAMKGEDDEILAIIQL